MHSGHAPQSGTVHLSAFGVPVAVHVAGNCAAEAESAIRAAWQWCLADTLAPERLSPDGLLPEEPIDLEVVLDDDPELVARTARQGAVAGCDVETVMHALSPAVTVAAITHRAGSLLMLHACALADPTTGATVALVGPSGMGKTTIARTLGTSLAYVTDETVAILPDNTVLPYPKPLSVRHEGKTAFKEQVAPGLLGLIPPPTHLTLAAVVLLDRHDGAPLTPSAEVVPTLRAIAEIAGEVSFLPKLATPLQRLAALFAHVGGLQRVSYREASDLTGVLRDVLLQES
jgi:hypothetical protein